MAEDIMKLDISCVKQEPTIDAFPEDKQVFSKDKTCMKGKSTNSEMLMDICIKEEPIELNLSEVCDKKESSQVDCILGIVKEEDLDSEILDAPGDGTNAAALPADPPQAPPLPPNMMLMPAGPHSMPFLLLPMQPLIFAPILTNDLMMAFPASLAKVLPQEPPTCPEKTDPAGEDPSSSSPSRSCIPEQEPLKICHTSIAPPFIGVEVSPPPPPPPDAPTLAATPPYPSDVIPIQECLKSREKRAEGDEEPVPNAASNPVRTPASPSSVPLPIQAYIECSEKPLRAYRRPPRNPNAAILDESNNTILQDPLAILPTQVCPESIDIINNSNLSSSAYASPESNSITPATALSLQAGLKLKASSFSKPSISFSAESSTKYSKENPFHCNRCSFTTKSHTLATKHLRTHALKCEKCNFKTVDTEALKTHSSIHAMNYLKCDQCPFVTYSKYFLEEHLFIHTGAKPFACSHCPFRAARLCYIRKHMKNHTGERPHKCTECSYTSLLKSSLNFHMKKHNGDEKPFACTQCSYRAVTKNRLQMHLVRHSSERPFECEHCPYRAHRKGQLLAHLTVHTGVKRFKCDYCSFTAKARAIIRTHSKRHEKGGKGSEGI